MPERERSSAIHLSSGSISAWRPTLAVLRFIVMTFRLSVRPVLKEKHGNGDKVLAFSNKSLAQKAKSGSRMHDTAVAQNILFEAFPISATRKVKTAIAEAFKALREIEKGLSRDVLDERPRRWTERRVKAIWKGEARRIDHYEINDLEQVQFEQAKAQYEALQADLRAVEAFLAGRNASRMGASPHP
ncbi:MAG: hypothetical protein CML24_11580 [Rhizobiales bacterium]|nr:hypothetical protein [Hyphomicrobiales bacterium]